jgi:branched-chain amino acid transport system substrate-binding protein
MPQLLQLRNAGVTALITIVAGLQFLNMMKGLKQMNWSPVLFQYSANTSKTQYLNKIGLADAAGLQAAMWLKDPADPAWVGDPGIAKYREIITKYGGGANPDDFFVITGYSAAQAYVLALKGMKEPTRKALLKSIDSIKGVQLDSMISGVVLNAGPGGRLIFSYQVHRYDGARWQPVGPVQDLLKLGVAA